jgi:hypothetical protein
MRTRSSVGLEHLTTDQEVIGSNPFESAILKFYKYKKASASVSDPGLSCIYISDAESEGREARTACRLNVCLRAGCKQSGSRWLGGGVAEPRRALSRALSSPPFFLETSITNTNNI